MNNHFNKRGRSNNHQRRRQGANPNRALDSNGPDVRIRGTAQQIYDKYQALARDATSSGDRVKAENYLQHAEHYFRVLRSVQGPQAQPFDQAGGEADVDGDQPSIGDGRDQRQQGAQFDGDDAAGAELAAEASPPPTSTTAGDDAAQEARSRESGSQTSGEQESRRRRRRPRRPREEGGSDEAAEDIEPVPAS